MRLRFIGNGERYLDGIPARDLETDDPAVLDICTRSGLYVSEEAPADPEPEPKPTTTKSREK